MDESNYYFKMRFSWCSAFENMDAEDVKSLVVAIGKFAETGQLEENEDPSGPMAAILWPMMKSEISRDRKQIENGKKGGRPKQSAKPDLAALMEATRRKSDNPF